MNRRTFFGKAFAAAAGLAAGAFGLLRIKKASAGTKITSVPTGMTIEPIYGGQELHYHYRYYKKWLADLVISGRRIGSNPRTAVFKVWGGLTHRDGIRLFDKVTILDDSDNKLFVGYIVGVTHHYQTTAFRDNMITIRCEDARGFLKRKAVSGRIYKDDQWSPHLGKPTLTPAWTAKDQQAFTNGVQQTRDRFDAILQWLDENEVIEKV